MRLNGRVSDVAVTVARRPRALWVLLAAVVLVAVVVIVGRVQAQNAQDTRTDEFYCTLAGIGPMDRGPKTGRLCADLIPWAFD